MFFGNPLSVSNSPSESEGRFRLKSLLTVLQGKKYRKSQLSGLAKTGFLRFCEWGISSPKDALPIFYLHVKVKKTHFYIHRPCISPQLVYIIIIVNRLVEGFGGHKRDKNNEKRKIRKKDYEYKLHVRKIKI